MSGACHRKGCYAPTDNACSNCVVNFCSENCADAAWPDHYTFCGNKGAFDVLPEDVVLEIVSYLFDVRHVKESIAQILKMKELDPSFQAMLQRLPRKFANHLIFRNYAGEIIRPDKEILDQLELFFGKLGVSEFSFDYFQTIIYPRSTAMNDDVVEELIELKPRLFFNKFNFEGALIMAADGWTEGVKIFLDVGFDVNYVRVESGSKHSLLSSAISNYHVDTARFLLEHGANPNIMDGASLNFATMRYYPTEFIALLIEYGVKLDFSSDKGTLYQARMNPEVTEYLLKRFNYFHPRQVRFVKNQNDTEPEVITLLDQYERVRNAKDGEEPPLKQTKDPIF